MHLIEGKTLYLEDKKEVKASTTKKSRFLKACLNLELFIAPFLRKQDKLLKE